MAKKQWKFNDVVGVDDIQRWEDKPDMTDLDGAGKALRDHIADTTNPHKVTKEQIGLENVENVKQASKQEFDEFRNQTNEVLNGGGVVKSVKINDSIYKPNVNGQVDLTKIGGNSGGNESTVIPGQKLWSGKLVPEVTNIWHRCSVKTLTLGFPNINMTSLSTGIEIDFGVMSSGAGDKLTYTQYLPYSAAMEDISDFTKPAKTSAGVGMVRSSTRIKIPKSALNGYCYAIGVKLTPYVYDPTTKNWSMPSKLATATNNWTKCEAYYADKGIKGDITKPIALSSFDERLAHDDGGDVFQPHANVSGISPGNFGIAYRFDVSSKTMSIIPLGCIYTSRISNDWGNLVVEHGFLLPIITAIYAN